MISVKIQAAYIDGFKNLSDVNITFNDITALISLNNFGKSNVLSAIDFGLAFIKSLPSDKSLMMSNANLIPMHKSLYGKNCKFQMETVTHISNVCYKAVYGYEFVWKVNEDEEPHIIKEYLNVKKIDGEKNQYVKYINRNSDTKSFFRRSESGRCSCVINVKPNELVINKLQLFDSLYYSKIVDKINNMTFYMENSLDVKDFYKTDPIIRKGFDGMTVDSENLPRVIFQLKQKYPEKFGLLVSIYNDLFPEIEDVIVEQYKVNFASDTQFPDNAPFVLPNAMYSLFVRNVNLIHPINFELMSDGAKRVFLILTRIILADISNISLIAIEEPENSVHPGLFKSYIQIISQLLTDCRVVITSHSPYIINYLDPSWIYVGINKKPGVASFFGFKKSGSRMLQRDAEKYKMSMGDYLYSMLADTENDWSDYLEIDDE